MSRDAIAELEELGARAAECTACRLHESRTTVVFGVGSATADLMFVGEGPGYHEDQQGEPFVGPSGTLLDQLLAEIGLPVRRVPRHRRQVPSPRQSGSPAG